MILENVCKQGAKPPVFNSCVQLSVNVKDTNRAVSSGVGRKSRLNNAKDLRGVRKTQIGPKRGCNLDPALSMNAKDLRYAC